MAPAGYDGSPGVGFGRSSNVKTVARATPGPNASSNATMNAHHTIFFIATASPLF